MDKMFTASPELPGAGSRHRVLLGVTGGVAAYKSAELARLLQRNNVEVRVAMTEAGTRFVTPVTFQALTGKPVVTQLTSILWWTLATLRRDERVGGFGRLLEEMPSAARATV